MSDWVNTNNDLLQWILELTKGETKNLPLGPDALFNGRFGLICLDVTQNENLKDFGTGIDFR